MIFVNNTITTHSRNEDIKTVYKFIRINKFTLSSKKP